MARFDKYLEEKDEEKKKAKEEFSNISLLDRMLSASKESIEYMVARKGLYKNFAESMEKIFS